MNLWSYLASMQSSRDADKRQEQEFKERRSLFSQQSVDRASERALEGQNSVKNELDTYKGKKDIDSSYADREAVNAAKRAVAAHYAAQGIPPETLKQGDAIFTAAYDRVLQEAKEASQKAKTGNEKFEREGRVAKTTEPFDINKATSNARAGANESAFNLAQLENPKNNTLRTANWEAGQALPAAQLARLMTTSVSPGETFRRDTIPDTSFSELYSGLIGQGSTQGEEIRMMKFGDQMIPDKVKVNTPGTIKPVFTGKIPVTNGQAAPEVSNLLTQPQPTPARKMPGRSSMASKNNGSDLPLEMQNAQPNETEQLIRRLLQKMYTEPKF